MYSKRVDVIGAEGRTRTDTAVAHRRILSPVRLPIPPPRHGGNSIAYICFC